MYEYITMAKPQHRTYSRQTLEALELLAQAIRAGRIGRKITIREMANRAGISRSLLQRIEDGDPSCAIGAVFEAAVIAGVSLFEAEPDRLQTHRAALTEKLSLLPQAARKPRRVVRDDF
jgi:transcriptional regulator with XRE-family HTH domain